MAVSKHIVATIDKPALQRGWRIVGIRHTFTIEAGDIIWLQGRNGRGKSTLLNMLAGLITPHKGRCLLHDRDGHDVPATERLAAINYLAHTDGLHAYLTVYESLQQSVSNLTKLQQTRILEQTIEQYQLAPLLSFRTGILSRGQQRRLALAIACLHPKQLRLLDEPTIGLDAQQVDTCMRLQQDYIAQGGTLVVTSHVPLPHLEFTRHITL